MSRETPPPAASGEDRFRSIAGQAPAMIWVTDPAGECVYLNSAWYSFTGQTEGEALGFGWLEASHPDDQHEAHEIFLAANSAHTPFHLEYRLRTACGDYRWVYDTGNPRFGPDGAFLGFVGNVIDIHDRHETEERLRTLTNAVPAFVWFATQNGDVHYLNDRWYQYTGQRPEEALPDGWPAALHPDDTPVVLEAWAAARAQQKRYEIECRYRRVDGRYLWHLVRAEPVRGEGGAVIAWIGTGIDIDAHRRAEERQALLINELNHRVKNTLATVQALASQTVKSTPDPEQFHESFEDRLISLSQAHDLLNATGWEGAGLADVVERALAPWSDQVAQQGPDAWLDPAQAVSVSMALHELGVNAAKYGALSTPGGRVSITWARLRNADGETLQLDWKESGGPPVKEPTRRGFGSRLLERGLGRELQGAVQMSFRPAGLECHVTFPLRLDQRQG